MRLYLKARKVISVNNENEVLLNQGKIRSRVASIVLQIDDTDFVCAKCIGKDKVTVMKQKALAGTPAEVVLTIEGRIITGKSEMPIYINEVHIKYILS